MRGFVLFVCGAATLALDLRELATADGEQFEERRLLEHLATTSGQDAAETVAGTLAAVRRHAGEQPQSDDITILAVRYAP